MSGNSPPDQPRKPKKKAKKGAGGESGGTDICDILIDVDLVGIRKAILAKVKIGDDLLVQLEAKDGYRSAVCVTATGEVVGSIAGVKGVATLINCLSKDRRYAVKVTAKSASSCSVAGGLVG